LRVVDREDAAGVITLPSLGAEEIALAVGPEGLEQLGIGSVVGRGGRLAARIEADGDLQLARLLAPRTLESDPQEPPSTSAQVSESGQPEASAGPQALEAEAPESAIESEISLGRLALERFEIEFEDRSRASPVALSLVPVDLEVTNFRTASDQPAELRLELGIGEEGRVAVSGKARAGPVAGQLAIEAKKIALAAFQPYVEEAARLDLLSGLLETRLDVALGPGGGDEPPAVTVKGDLRVDDLRTRDRMLEREFVGWRALRLDGIDLSPGRLHLAEVGLEGAAAAFVIDARGRSNAAAIFASGEEDDAGGTPGDDSGEAPLAISVERITLSDARVDFEDLSVDPPVGLVLGPLSGGVTGLSSVSGTRSQIDFEGHVNDRAPLHLTGEINPLAMESGGDLALTGRGIPLAVLGGYAGRYVGWDIASGGLDLDLDYHLEGRNLKARNHILFKGLDLGERVGERTTLSMSLPVALVVMRDVSGNLDFDLPVAGNLDDPDFSVLGVLGRTFTNLITKAATSPLALLQVRGGGDASRVAFAPGSDLLSEQELPSLEAVAKVLSDEPRIQLEIQGRADFELDGAALGVDPDPENEASVAALSALARGRADRVRDALAADDGFDAKRLVLGDIEVGKLATDGVITTNLWLSTR
ncbi:MAG: DUF748 domain-containing protein, partial [Deltaproteobacteria bacterium]|nr:DUF748 domain-containing protein [Deltaproteobacteria bacterium]